MNKSVKAYQTVCKHLGIKPARITEDISEISDATLVIVPNKLFDYKQLIKLANKFGENQPYETHVSEELYKLYSSEELSGNIIGKKAYRYLYIPTGFNAVTGTVEQQKATHKDEHIPSVLEAICFWFTLREFEKILDFNSTYIRHFDLEPNRVDSWSYVPGSFVYGVGGPYLYYSYAGYDDYGRVSVGEKLEPLSSTPAFEFPEEIEINGVKYRKYS